MNNNFKILQKIKIDLFPINSYYSFKNPEKLKKFYYRGLNIKEFTIDKDILYRIFNETKEGFFNAKLDEVKRIINMTNKNHNYLKRDKDKINAYKNKNKDSIQDEDIQFAYWNSYLKICLSIAYKFFSLKNGKIYIDGNCRKNNNELNVGKDFNNKFEWTLVKQLVDTDILLGAYMVEENISEELALEMWQSPMFTTETVLEKKLEKGLAETHMHMGATKRFSTVWTSLMNNKITHTGNDEKKLKVIKLDSLSGEISISKDLYSARIIRLIMAYFLNKKAIGNVTFENFLNTQLPKNASMNGKAISANLLTSEKIKLIREVIADFISQKGAIDENKIKGLFNDLREQLKVSYFEVSGFNLDIPLDNLQYKENYKGFMNNEILSEDILTSVFNEIYYFNKDKNFIKHNFKSIVMPESILIYRALSYLKNNEEDLLFSNCFWQYIKLKNIVYTNVNQSLMGGKGLDIFVKFYGNQSGIKIKNPFAEAFYSQIKDQNIKKMELRTGPSGELEDIKNTLIETFKVYKMMLNNEFIINKIHKPVTLIGIVYHFIKRDDCDLNYKCTFLSKDKDEVRTNNTRYGNNIETYKRQAEIIAMVRREIPEIQNYIVGIDAASKELDIDPYYFKSAYEILRNANKKNILVEKDIGFTYHVGEDFRDIISGLRAVDEVIEVLKFRSGDRLGHGIVLGINIDKWVEMNPIIYLKAEEYLDNLLWEWGLYSKSKDFIGDENINYIEQQIFDAVEYIFGFSEGLRVRDLYNSYIRKINNETYNLDKCEMCGLMNLTKEKYYSQSKYKLQLEEHWTSNLIYEAYSCKYFIKEFAKTVTLNMDNSLIKKYKRLQEYMRSKISNKQIIIELNPSSNLSIGEFNSFEDYHIINLSSPEKEDIIVTLNTDDPVVFNTNLSNEYALMYDIMMKRGEYSSKEIIEWLDRLRKNGLEYSFITDRNMSYEEISGEVNIILGKLENLRDS